MEQGREKIHTTRRTLYLPALIVAAVLVACAVVLLAVSEGAEAALAGKNGKIAYVRFGRGGEIFTINPGGGGNTKVTNGDSPAYSPNGRRIAYDGIYTINAGGGGKYKVTEGRNASYSPDGKRMAYVCYDGGRDPEICTINVGGGGKRQVTHNNEWDFDPSYSPNGKKIAYTGYKVFGSSDDEDFDSEIYTIKVGGGGKSQVTNSKHHASYPSWGSRP